MKFLKKDVQDVLGTVKQSKIEFLEPLEGTQVLITLIEQDKVEKDTMKYWDIDRWFPSSKTCSVCPNIQDMPLRERVYHCQNCGEVMDRDLNGSINLENWTKNADSLSVNPCGLEGAVSLG